MSIKAMKMALEALDIAQAMQERHSIHHAKTLAAYDALRAAIAEASMQRLTDVQQEMEQEPVAWMYHGIRFDDTPHDSPSLIWRPEYMDAMSASKGAKATPFYAKPPRREWVGLTDEEIIETYEEACREHFDDLNRVRHHARAIEAKLKEKNS